MIETHTHPTKSALYTPTPQSILEEILLNNAIYARQHDSFSYRLHVGASAVAHTKNQSLPSVLLSGNRKVRPTDTKECAEMRIMRQAINYGCTNVSMVCIFANAENNNPSQMCTPTLHPCTDCLRVMLTESIKDGEGFFRFDTLVHSVSPRVMEGSNFETILIHEVHTIAELLIKHGFIDLKKAQKRILENTYRTFTTKIPRAIETPAVT